MRVSIAVCLFVCTVASAASAQTATGGSIRGYVKDEQDAIVPGVRLTATSPDAPGRPTAISDESGYYGLLDLPPGIYTITAELDGFAKWVRDDVAVRAGLNISLAVVMKPGAVTETVEVKAETPLLESRSASQAINLSGDLQRALPLSGRRNWADSLLLAPGVASQEAFNNTQWFWVHGAELDSNTFDIDGADVGGSTQSINSNIDLSTEAVQDVRIKLGAADATTPLGFGASLSVVTKSGTNDFKGAAVLVGRAKSWNASNVAGGTASAVTLLQPDLALGGPLVRDRWWFFGSYRRQNASTGIDRTAAQLAILQALVPGFQPYDLKNQSNISFLKTSLALGPAHQIAGSYQRDVNPYQTSGGQKEAPVDQVSGDYAAAVRWSSTWTASLVTQIGFSFNNKGTAQQFSNVDEPVRSVYQSVAASGGRLVGIGQLASLGAPGAGPNAVRGEKSTIAADLTYFTGHRLGTHQLQAGIFLQPHLVRQIVVDYVNGGFALEDRVLVNPGNPSQGSRVFHKQIYDVTHQEFINVSVSVVSGRAPRPRRFRMIDDRVHQNRSWAHETELQAWDVIEAIVKYRHPVLEPHAGNRAQRYDLTNVRRAALSELGIEPVRDHKRRACAVRRALCYL